MTKPLPDFIDEQQEQLHDLFDPALHVLVPIGNKQRDDLVTLVDLVDADDVLSLRWSLSGCAHHRTAYARRYNNRSTVKLHRQLLTPPRHLQVDHINHNGLDNRRCNLRLATSSQNNLNHQGRRNGTSKFRGVYWHKDRQKWYARIQINGREKHLGCFTSERDAARAYDEAVRKIAGKFAYLNFK